MIGWLIALGILILLANIPLGVQIHYDEDGLRVRMLAGFLKFTVVPGKTKKHKPKKEKKKKKSHKSVKNALVKENHKKGGSILRFWPVVRLGLAFLGDLRRKLRVKRLELKVILAGGDPCDLAINYGRAWAAVGNLFPLLEHAFVIKKRDVEVECDFMADETTIIGRLDMTITLGKLIALIVRYGVRCLGLFSNNNKGGASK